MPTQKDLFGSDVDPVPVLTPTARGPHLTAQQQTFNRLIAKIEKVTQVLADHRRVADSHRVRHAARIEPLHQQQRKLNRGMVLFLHGRLQGKGWTRQQQNIMKEILCALALPFIEDGDQEMLALHDQYSKSSFEEQQKAALAEAGAIMEEVLGIPPKGEDDFNSVDEMLNETLRWAKEAEEQEQARQARRKPGKRQQKAEKAQQESQTTLREIYRKLASTLHPDREPDTAERARKTALMSEVNTAYGRRDLLALLQLQLRIEQIDLEAIGKLSVKKLDAMIAVLKDQAKSLEGDLLHAEDQIRMEFGLPWNSPINAATLSKHLNVLARTYESDIKEMQSDLWRIADDRVFKHWLKEQRQEMAERDLLGLMDLDVFDGPTSRRR